jgi:CopG family nickel-responsive transcriptional regulator
MKKNLLCRSSLSISADLLAQFDAMCKTRGYQSRSQAVADMVRGQLIEHRAQSGSNEIAGNITLVYDHHRRNIQAQLTHIQHDHGPVVISTLHVHLDHHNCMEVLAVRGVAKTVRGLADKLIAVKGIKHGKMTVTTTGVEFHR